MTSLLPAARRMGPRSWLVLGAVAFVVLLLFMARESLAPFVIGIVFAYLLNPLVKLVEGVLPFRRRAGVARVSAVALVYLVVIGGLAMILAFALPPLFNQINRFFMELPQILEESQAVLQTQLQELQTHVPPEVQRQIDDGINKLGANLSAAVQDTALHSFSLVTSTFSVLLGSLAVPVWLFFVLKDRERMTEFMFRLFPTKVWPDLEAVFGIIDRILSAYIRAQLLLGLVIGVAVAVGLTLLGIPFALVLGLIAGLTEMIPVVGPILGSVAGIVVALATKPDLLPWVLVFYLVVQQVENNLLVPRVQGEALELHPAVIMVLLVAASDLAGFGGMLVAAPLAAVARDVFLYLYRRLGNNAERRREELTVRGPDGQIV